MTRSVLINACLYPAFLAAFLALGAGLGSRFCFSSSSETVHLIPPEGTSSLAVQRMAFRTRVRKSGLPQFLWEWPPVKPKPRPPSGRSTAQARTSSRPLASTMCGRARAATSCTPLRVCVVGLGHEDRGDPLHLGAEADVVVPLVVDRERLDAAGDRVFGQALDLGRPVRVGRVAGLVVAAEPVEELRRRASPWGPRRRSAGRPGRPPCPSACCIVSRRSPWIIGWPPPPSMKKTTALAPSKTLSSSGQPPATNTGSMPGTSFRHLTSSFVPALNSWSPGPVARLARDQDDLRVGGSAPGPARQRPGRPGRGAGSRPISFLMRPTSSGVEGRPGEVEQ